MANNTPLKRAGSLFIICLCAVIHTATAQSLVSAQSQRSIPGYEAEEKISAAPANENLAVFPAILTGNEENSLEYIENFSKARRDYLIRTYNRGKRLFGKTTLILKKYNLPQELKVLLALESGFNANAVSHAGAVGYWQFMDETAKEYGLKIFNQPSKQDKAKAKKQKLSPDSLKKLNKLALKDDRRNFNKSTYAAARYLRDRGRNLNNDWLLVVASYNCGIGNVWDAMAASGKENATFWDIKDLLPAETRNYVMNFITLNVIFSNYEKFASNTLCFKAETEDETGEDAVTSAAAPTAPSMK